MKRFNKHYHHWYCRLLSKLIRIAVFLFQVMFYCFTIFYHGECIKSSYFLCKKESRQEDGRWKKKMIEKSAKKKREEKNSLFFFYLLNSLICLIYSRFSLYKSNGINEFLTISSKHSIILFHWTKWNERKKRRRRRKKVTKSKKMIILWSSNRVNRLIHLNPFKCMPCVI